MAISKLNTRCGQILLENIISIMLIGLFMLGISATFIWTGRVNFINRHQLQAQDYCKQSLEQLLMKPYSDSDLSLAEHTAESFLALPADCDLNAATRKYLVEDLNATDSAEGKKITVTISWTEEGKIKEEKLYGLVIEK